jgi:uncharacterized protein
MMQTSTDDAPPEGGREPELRALHPRVRALWWLAGVLGVLQVAVPLAILDYLVPHPLRDGLVTAVVVAIGLLLAAVVPVVRYRRWRYALRTEDLWVRQGVLTVTVTVVPYRRLQFVDTRQGPLERLFGLSQLVVHTAALGTSARVPGLQAAEAERLREALAKLEPDDAVI